MGIRVAHQGDIIAHLQHRIAVRVRENAVAADALNVAAGLAVNTQLAQIFTISPRHQLRTDAVGADHRQIDLTPGVGIETALAGDLLGAGLQILMLQLRHIAGADDQADQANQIGQRIAEAQMIERKGELIAGHAEVAKRIPGADQHGSGRHRAGEHPGRQADIPLLRRRKK